MKKQKQGSAHIVGAAKKKAEKLGLNTIREVPDKLRKDNLVWMHILFAIRYR
jgi:hypothetical protein